MNSPRDRSAQTTPPSLAGIVIAIPTYRRLPLLGALLDSLGPELAGHDTLVIIGDNDGGAQVPALVDRYRGRFRDLRSIAVAERGIAANRNALCEAACVFAPDWRWLIMLDDDGQVRPGWFSALTEGAQRLGTDVTGGAVVCPMPSGAGIFARNSEFANRPRRPTGRVAPLGIAQNICIARRVETLVARPWFNPEYGLSGGEDHEFLMRVHEAGGSFGWVDEALVVEPQPPERLTPRAIVYRSLTTGATTARIDRQIGGRLAALRATGRYIVLSTGSLVLNTLLWRPDRIVRAVISVAYAIGRVPGVGRLAGQRYGGSST